MNTQIRYLFPVLILVALGVAGVARADATVTRSLNQSIAVPVGDSVKVENLVGHMTVTRGSGSLQVTAKVVAGGSDAAALARSVKLDVSTTGKQVTVHVHYPVNQYSTYLYNPPHVTTSNNGSACFLGLICIRGNGHSDIDYQGARVRVNENGNSGTPLYVDVAVQLPASVNASFANAMGLLEASHLTDTLSFATEGSDISLRNLTGDVTAETRGGDIDVNNITSQTLDLDTSGGDVNGAGLKGSIKLQTAGGDAELKTIAGTLHASTSGGDLRANGELSALRTLYAHTSGGDLRVSGDASTLRDLDVSTGGGDAVLRLNKLSMHLEASASGGDVNVHLPDISGNVVSRDDYFSGDIGKAAGQGTIHSGGGDITVSGN